MSAETISLQADTEPRVLDTYALVYSFALVALMPGMLMLSQLPFRTYTFAYVSLATAPFLIGLIATFFTDSRDGLRTMLLRTAILTPIIVFTGVGLMFTSSLLLVPASRWIVPENFAWLTWVSMGLLALLAAPLPVALFRRLAARPVRWTTIFQIVFLLLAMGLVIAAMVATAQGTLTRELARKDIVIYIIGAMTWYLPAFGITAGAWRRVGLV